MFVGQLIYKQVLDLMPLSTFRRFVAKYRGNYKVRSFSCLDQFLCMTFAQITFRENLRDIEVCLRSQNKKLYHMGIRGKISRSTLADANENRDCRIYAELAQSLIATARDLYNITNENLTKDKQVHYGRAQNIVEHRANVLESAFKEHTKRFKGKMPKPFPLPKAAWINKPENDKAVLP